MKGSESLGVTPAQLWRELCVALGLWLLGKRLPYQKHVQNTASLTVAVIMCEDEETFANNFVITPRYHVPSRSSAVN